MGLTDEFFALFQANSIDLNRGDLAPVQAVAKELSMVVVLGHQEIDGAISGSMLFNSVAIIDADGKLLNNHRKLMPANPVRIAGAYGYGSTLNVVETACGRIGALICWENYMPLARFAFYAQNIDIYVAPTWDSGTSWLATMQHIAREGGYWVVGCATSPEAADVPQDLARRERLFPNPGCEVIYKPFGACIAGPMHREKGLLVAEVEVYDARASRRKFDVCGHYARPDVFTLKVNRTRQTPIMFET
jgi:nitrilase